MADQRKEILKDAAAHAIDIVAWYEDDAISGDSAKNRPGFQRMIRDAQDPAREWTLIVCYDNSRFGRMTVNEKGYYRYILDQAGVKLRYVTGAQPDGLYGDTIQTIQDSESRQFLLDLSVRTMRGEVSLAEEGWWVSGLPPYGFDLMYLSPDHRPILLVRYRDDGRKELRDPASGTLIRVTERKERIVKGKGNRTKLVLGLPERVAVVRRIFRLALTMGTRSIANLLNEEGVPPPRDPQWSSLYPGRWTHSTIGNILRNPAYAGMVAWNRTTIGKFHKYAKKSIVPKDRQAGPARSRNAREDWIVRENAHEPLVSRDLFDQIQKIMARRREEICDRWLRSGRAKMSPYLLPRLMKCTHCGRHFQGFTKDGAFYVCAGYVESGRKVCRRALFEKEALEGAVLNILKSRVTQLLGRQGQDLVIRLVGEQLGDSFEVEKEAIKRMERRKAEIESSIDRMLTLLSPENRELANEKIGWLKKELADVQAKLHELRARHVAAWSQKKVATLVHDHLGRFDEVMKHGRLEDRKTFIRTFIERIDLDPTHGRGIVFVRPLPRCTSFEDSHGPRTLLQKINAALLEYPFTTPPAPPKRMGRPRKSSP